MNKKVDEIKAIILKADRAINSAKKDLDDGDYDFATSRAYYSVFYMLEAVLLTKDLSFSKHSAVISAFNRHFVKEGIFPKYFSKYIKKLMKDRETGDYSFFEAINREEARENIKMAEELVETLKKHLQNSCR